MRLIDADMLKKGMSEKTKTDGEASRFIDIIDSCPTAYSIENVINAVDVLLYPFLKGNEEVILGGVSDIIRGGLVDFKTIQRTVICEKKEEKRKRGRACETEQWD